jgi:hypothetical protein
MTSNLEERLTRVEQLLALKSQDAQMLAEENARLRVLVFEVR